MDRSHPCSGCAYFYAEYAPNLCCNYIFDTGHRRPCPPGADCTVYQKAKGKRTRKRMPNYFKKNTGRK